MKAQTILLAGAMASVALGLALAAGTAKAQVAPRDQRDPDIAFLVAREEFLLVWSEDRGAGARLYAKRVRANGTPLGGADGGEWEATLATPTAGYPGPSRGVQRWPAVIDGLVVYSERKPGGTDFDLYAQRLFDNGRPTGAPMLVASGPGDQKFADVALVNRGRAGAEFLIVWSEDTRDAGDVMGLRVDYALRRSRGPAFPIAQGPGTAEDPVIQRDLLDDKSFLVLFTDDRAGNKDILGTRLVESGLPRGGPLGGHFPVVASPQDDYAPALVSSKQEFALLPTPTPDPRQSRPDTEGPRSLLVWTTDDVTNGPNILAQRLNSNGLPKGNPFPVADGAGTQAWPAAVLRQITGDEPGSQPERDEWLTVWVDDGLGTLDVLGARIGINGIVRQTTRVLAAD